MFKRDKNNDIKRSLEIIRREKKKLFKMRLDKVYKLFKRKNNSKGISFKEYLFSSFYFSLFGFILCLLILFIFAGGRNYIRLYFELSKFINVYDDVTSNYYGDIDKSKMLDDAIDGMINGTGDNYTTYSDKKNTSSFLENIEGTYSGIGCSIRLDENNNIVLNDIFDGGSADNAGMKKGDIILKIDDIDYSNKSISDMADYVKSSSREYVKFLIKRDGDLKEILVKLSKVETPTVESKVYDIDGKKIGYLSISIFSSVTYKQFEKKLVELEKNEKIDGLVIDVRDNTGGYLGTVSDIVSLFLKKGSIIYQLEDGKKITKHKDNTKEYRNYPVSVLINKNSASASEILASAIKEVYNGDVVGINSFGKGTVQKTKTLKDGTMIKYTVQRWLTPKGNWINEVGVAPTIEVENTNDDDLQLNSALDSIKRKLK